MEFHCSDINTRFSVFLSLFNVKNMCTCTYVRAHTRAFFKGTELGPHYTYWDFFLLHVLSAY